MGTSYLELPSLPLLDRRIIEKQTTQNDSHVAIRLDSVGKRDQENDPS